MKKINSIGYGHKIIGVAAMFLFIVLGASHLAAAITNHTTFLLFAKVSYAIGCMNLLFLLALLAIEFSQDKKINKYYESNKNVKLTLKNGLYECQSCGNRQVKLEHRNCNACGIYFKNLR